MPAPSQRTALGTLFLLLALAFAGIAYAGVRAASGGAWVIGVAAAVLALWLGSLAVRALMRR